MVAFKTLSIFLSAGIFGLQALAGPIPNTDLTKIATFKEIPHVAKDSLINSLNGLRKRFSKFKIDSVSPPSEDPYHQGHINHDGGLPDAQQAANRLALRTVSENIQVQVVTLSPEEKEILRQKLSGHLIFDSPSTLGLPEPPGLIVALLIIGTIGGALFLIFPVGWLF
ncbi:hypothetical protein TWF718_009521 [Orbilia javanica]|uniref:Uncharacterized protein n=1 Tax=Orbilia javanica TaxID=47235 RepID=A0AAN8RBI0_9PEZI